MTFSQKATDDLSTTQCFYRRETNKGLRMAEQPNKKATDRWLDLMLAECSLAFLGWSYAKAKSKDPD
jgi:hypothetical protein